MMNYEDMRKAWQSQGGPPKLNIRADLILHEVQRNKASFDSMIFWRDVREVGISLLGAVLFIYWTISDREWFFLPIVAACLWVGLFMLVDRRRQARGMSPPADPLRKCIETSLRQVDHQIWLLRNVLWWYLLPFYTGIGIFIGSLAWSVLSEPGPVPLWVSLVLGGYVLLSTLLYWGIFRLNQRAVKKTLLPRRQELEDLLASLGAV